MKFMSWLRPLALVAGALAAGACDEPSAALAEGTYVARVEDDIFLALVLEGGDVLAYACDGDARGVALAAWLDGEVQGERLDARHAKKPISLHASFDGVVLAGELDLGEGVVLPFAATRAAGEAGLYQADDGDLRGGWIFDAAGDQRGAVLRRSTGDIASVQLAGPQQRSALAFGADLAITKVRTLAP